MKKLLMMMGVTGALLCSYQASARETCKAVLENSRGRTLEEFEVSDGSYDHSCRVALADCHRAQADRSEPRTQCRLADDYGGGGGGGYPPSDRYTHRCQASLKSGRGETLRIIYGTGFSQAEACDSASYQCEDLAARTSRGAYCEVAGRLGRRPGGGGGRLGSTCEFGLYERLTGRLLRTYSASSYDRDDACEQADDECSEHSDGPLLTCRELRSY